MTETQREQALELMETMAIASRPYDSLVVMSVLEAAMTAEIHRQDPLVGQLFEEIMGQFKKEAAVLLGLSALMKAVKQAKQEQDIDGTPKVPIEGQ
jgi:hypothetical protein